MFDDVSTCLADNMKRLREARGLSQAGLAERSGVPRPTIAHLETGTANPTLAVATKLALALGVGLDDLVAKQTQGIVVVEPGETRGDRRGKVRRFDLVPDYVGPNTDFERIVISPGGRFTVDGSQSSAQILACERGDVRLTAEDEEATLGAEHVAVLTTKVECASPKGAIVYRLSGLLVME